MDDLTRIESLYGCVAEYNRCMEEEADREWDRILRETEQAKANKRKLEEGKDRTMYFCDDCIGCKHYEDVGPTRFGREIDDVTHGICHAERKCTR